MVIFDVLIFEEITNTQDLDYENLQSHLEILIEENNINTPEFEAFKFSFTCNFSQILINKSIKGLPAEHSGSVVISLFEDVYVYTAEQSYGKDIFLKFVKTGLPQLH